MLSTYSRVHKIEITRTYDFWVNRERGSIGHPYTALPSAFGTYFICYVSYCTGTSPRAYGIYSWPAQVLFSSSDPIQRSLEPSFYLLFASTLPSTLQALSKYHCSAPFQNAAVHTVSRRSSVTSIFYYVLGHRIIPLNNKPQCHPSPSTQPETIPQSTMRDFWRKAWGAV